MNSLEKIISLLLMGMIMLIVMSKIAYELYSGLPRRGVLINIETKQPIRDHELQVDFDVKYTWRFPDESLHSYCAFRDVVNTDENGNFTTGYVPLTERNWIDLRARIDTEVFVYISPDYDSITGFPVNIYEPVDSKPELSDVFKVNRITVETKPFDLIERIEHLSDLIYFSGWSKCREGVNSQIDWQKILVIEAQSIYPLWLDYLRENPYKKSDKDYSQKKYSGDVFFIEVLGENVRSELNMAGYPNAEVNCPYIYKGIEKPSREDWDIDACF